MDTGMGRAFVGFLLGCLLVGAFWAASRPKATVDGPELTSKPDPFDLLKVEPPGLDRLRKAAMLAELQQVSILQRNFGDQPVIYQRAIHSPFIFKHIITIPQLYHGMIIVGIPVYFRVKAQIV